MTSVEATRPTSAVRKYQDEQIVVLGLAGEQFGIDIGRVQEIIRPQAITHVPKAPAYVEGVINLRGRIIPVLDLRARFGLGKSSETRETRIAVSDIGGKTVGLVVDQVSEVLQVEGTSVEAPSQVLGSADKSFVRGIAKVGDRLVILLDLDSLLDTNEHAALADVVN